LNELEELRQHLENVLSSQKLAVLATQQSGQPYTNLLAFAATEDLRYLLFATTRATRKYANLIADSRLAMLVDTRMNQAADFEDATAVTAMGSAQEATGQDRERLLKIYLSKHPQLEGFATAPTTALFKVRVEKFDVVRRFQNVMEYRPAP